MRKHGNTNRIAAKQSGGRGGTCVISTLPRLPTGVYALRPPMILGATKAITL
jgi:hypothetical protein